MATTFKDLMKLDAENVLVNSAEFGETVTYTPESTGTPKEITAVIDRAPEDVLQDPEVGEARTRTAVIEILLDATLGVAVPVVRDALVFDSVTWYVARVDLEPDQGMVSLTVRTTDVDEFGPSYPIGRV